MPSEPAGPGRNPVPGSDAEQGQQGGGHVDQPAMTVDQAQAPDPGPGQDEGGPGLDDAERAVLAPVLRLLVGGGVEDAEIGGAGMVEDLGRVLPGVGVGIGPPIGMAGRPLRRQGDEAGGVLVGQRIATLDRLDVEGPAVGRRADGGSGPTPSTLKAS